MNQRTVRALSLLALTVALALAGCTAAGTNNSGKADSAGGEIEGIEWRVVSSSDVDLSGFGITATFKDDTVAGRGAVNSYSAPCVLKADGSMEVGDVTSTLMAGSDEANAAESAYFTLLRSMVSHKLEGDTLVLTNSAGAQLTLER